VTKGLEIRVVKPAELRPEELERWRALRAATAVSASPFMEPEFTLAVGEVSPGARVAVISEGGETAGFFPFERNGLGQGRAVGLGVSDCQGAVLRPGLGLSGRALMRACSLSTWEFDNLEAGQDLFRSGVVERFGAPIADISAGFEAYQSALLARSPKFLKSTLAKERRLGRREGEVRFVFDERDPEGLRTLMAWKSAQYRRTGRRDRFAKEWISGLLERLHDSRAPGCTGVLSVLYAGDRPIAAHFGPRSRTVLCCWFPAYDINFARYSPGLILHLRMLEAAAAEGVRTFDFGRGDAVYKDAFKTGELEVSEGFSARPGPGAALHWAAREPVRFAHSYVRNRPRLARTAQRTLNRLGTLRGR
jgi:CelD/BcsL family acetyltransferase involved in cellulose biosynthesis